VGAVFAYIAGSSFVLQDVYGISRDAFAISFGVNGVGIVIGSQSAGFLVRRHDPRRLLLIGLSGLVLGALLLLSSVALDAGRAAFIAALWLTVSWVGFCIPNATALALAAHERQAGSASALLGLSQFTIGAAVAPIVGIAGRQTAWPLVLVMAALALGAMTAVTTLTRDAPELPAAARSIEAGSLP
jgi:DHA1 family bicyclomycin/chloramphenicol resistance-like MFS transporter